MSKPNEPDLTELRQFIAESMEEISKLKEDRSALNAKIQEKREGLKARGIPKKALDMAVAYMSMEPEERRGFDTALQLCREAGGLPMQLNKFEDLQTAPAE